MNRFWQNLLGWPLLILLLIAALWCVAEVVAEARFTPAPIGNLHRISFEEDSSHQIVMRLPIGWEPETLPNSSDGTTKLVFQHKGQAYPSVYLEAKSAKDTSQADWVKQHVDEPKLELLADVTESNWAFDTQRAVRWRAVNRNPAQLEIETVRSNVHFLVRVFYGSGTDEVRQTVRNIIDQMHLAAVPKSTNSDADTPTETESEQTPVVKNDEEQAFAMGNGTEVTTARRMRLNALIWVLAILVVLIVVHVCLSVAEVNERIRDTKRLMAALRRGVPLGRAWDPPETEDTPPP